MNERQEQIVDNHRNNRCEIVTHRDDNGRARACMCANQYAGETVETRPELLPAPDPMSDAPEWFRNPEGMES